ncbi:MAG: RecQ family ATP-dependent DNA helicase [Bacteroidales bacterium]
MKLELDRIEAEKILQEKFKINSFHDEQWDAIQEVLSGKKVLLIERTGYGKSLCFQFPAILFEGTTIVFSPLLALMRDQVSKLRQLGIAAACINSEQEPELNEAILADALKDRWKILYIAPERQENQSWIEAARKIKLAMVVIDEAHCVSVWGHDFRPAFRRIINLVRLLPEGFPVLATTATATKKVERDVAAQIGTPVKVIRGNLIRDNFQLFVVPVNSEEEKMIWLARNIPTMEGSGVIYTGTRINTDIYTHWLEYNSINASGYSASLDPDTRISIEKGLMENKWKCVISTNALGMGIDKPDIRFIIHTQFPQSPVHYYQEIGRAGRDGKSAKIILLYNPADRDLPDAFIEGGRPPVAKYQRVIDLIRQELLREKDIVKRLNLRITPFRVIKNDLIDQGIIREVVISGEKKMEYIPGASHLDGRIFEELRREKRQDLEAMIAYAETKMPRMQFLRNFLGDEHPGHIQNCDNTGLTPFPSGTEKELENKIVSFRETFFPEVSPLAKGTVMISGVAAAYYGFSEIGTTLHRCKYESGEDFPDHLISLTLKAYRKYFGSETFDYIVYVPPTKSGKLVKNFALKIASALKITFQDELVKTRPTAEQKVFENSYLKKENVKDAFRCKNPAIFIGKKVLIVDDIYDTGATMKELGRYFSSIGVIVCAPLVIARTVAGDLND